MTTEFCTHDTLLCRIVIHTNGTSITGIAFDLLKEVPVTPPVSALTVEAIRQIDEYFAGKRKEFKLPLDLEGTPFQKAVWQQLALIPYGKTVSYKQIAIASGSPNGARAVGMACNKNPIPIIIPCHRVVGSNGGLTGFACGTDTKQSLLELESHN